MPSTSRKVMTYSTPDGKYTLTFSNSILRFEGEGSFGRDIVERYNQDMKKVVSKLNGLSWAFLGFMTGAGILTPEAEASLTNAVIWRAEHGMQCCALVIGDTQIPAIVSGQFDRIYKTACVSHQFFKDEKDALVWLAGRGFEG